METTAVYECNECKELAMNLVPWKNKRRDVEPETALTDLRQEMGRLFDSFMHNPFGSLMHGFADNQGWVPALDIAETDAEVIVKAEVPGVDPKDLEITVSGNRLTLAGEKKVAHETEGSDYYHSETS